MDNELDLNTPWRGASFTKGIGFPYDFVLINNKEDVIAEFRENGDFTIQDCERFMNLFKKLPSMYQTLVRARNVLNGLMSMTDEEYHGARGMVDFAYGKLVADMDKVLNEVKGVKDE